MFSLLLYFIDLAFSSEQVGCHFIVESKANALKFIIKEEVNARLTHFSMNVNACFARSIFSPQETEARALCYKERKIPSNTISIALGVKLGLERI